MKKTVTIALAVAASVLASSSAFAAGDVASGEKLFKQICGICHNGAAGAPAKVGPNLWGVTTRPAGSFAGFAYSNAFKAAVAKGLAWNDTTLDGYLTNPNNYLHSVSGDAASGPSKMMLPKVLTPQDRADAIAYLNTLK
jgi:cytochrome c